MLNSTSIRFTKARIKVHNRQAIITLFLTLKQISHLKDLVTKTTVNETRVKERSIIINYTTISRHCNNRDVFHKMKHRVSDHASKTA